MKLTVLGATGSIGVSTLDVVARHPERFEIVALTGYSRIDVLARQCVQFRPAYAVVGRADDAVRLSTQLVEQGVKTQVLYGPAALIQVASLAEVDAVMAAIVGAAGLEATLAAARSGKRILLANKEALVMAGAVMLAEAKRGGAVLLPIDSEHNAVFQSMPSGYNGDMAAAGVKRVLLTASGGPFRTKSLDELATVTPEQAIAHPNWSMGRKISVDSATLMNKGLEVIEAHWLFNVPADAIEVVIHPQSVIHSLVDYTDGSMLAQLGNPDMRTPIAHALAWPQRIDSGVASLDLVKVSQLSFEPPDRQRFPCLGLAYRALRAQGNAAAVLNAANEIAVEAFLARRLPFLKIADVIAMAMDTVPFAEASDLAAVLDADRQARAAASQAVAKFQRR
ncbi:MAG TPA: 1-deoxy-D-xylulose-5-phosphate reductoisomerase [Rhodocyclaceae bacterium]|nr:1-deoxy-D-xylulose-5-phosphate reductoisomerase [Rhodocyclaceae bacterium]